MISNKTKQYLTLIIKLVIVFGAFYFIYDKLAHDDKLSWKQFSDILQHKFTIAWILFMLCFSVLNRFLEILKWKNLVLVMEKISLFTATKQVLAGVTAGLFTPNGIGEYAGKALYYPKTETKRVLFLNLICNGIQMVLSIIFGLIGLLYLGYTMYFFILLGIGFLILTFLFLTKNANIKGYSIALFLEKISEIPKKIHQKNILLAIARYLTFSHQYYFLFLLFGIEIDYFTLMATITAVYFIASSLPSFQFLDFVVKGGVAIWFFDKLNIDEYVVLFISTFMWLLNVVLPVVIGSYFVLIYKTRETATKKQSH
ncbi:hypothetical protein G6N05_05100 [Flavobacterium sp. F372]|uniref:Flippase-like domain-containing protein n=1 Tax=Flavobacterium bernardetii TaxID=2813823 RepID=A0ABR7J141_9FLAO|nr:lysylphosphatidylglycerol synthase domain-containing protein [Flavobacterium bernardetii]MBC5835756.1 flippase-like domain-containing protein [Flavobacterium bernardetii]NHF69487.1 hypothetical protein [Flavobacterium bernardetii]